MNSRILFPRLFVLSAALFITVGAQAQSSESELRQTNPTINPTAAPGLQTEPMATKQLEEERLRAVAAAVTPGISPAIKLANALDLSLLVAMQSHIGAAYHFNRTGPGSFDCSGFVWRSFQDVGVNFQRGPARSYWATMEAPAASEQFKFGTLVFFSNLRHVGIVVDEKGFYHSARHGGVMYSPFNEYWLSRIDGFRRAPSQPLQTDAANSKQRISKPAATAIALEQNNEP